MSKTIETTDVAQLINDPRQQIIANAKHALQSVVDGTRKTASGTANLALAFRAAYAEGLIPLPAKNWDKVNASIPEAAQFIGVVVKGTGKASNAEIQAIRRAVPIAAYLVIGKASVEISAGKNKRRANAHGEFYIDPAVLDNATDNEEANGYAERSAGSVLNMARSFFGGAAASNRATKVKAALDTLSKLLAGDPENGMVEASEFPADAWELAGNVSNHLKRLIDERTAMQRKNDKKVA